jgi:transcriptional regulator with XRE-family HTH domain
MQEARRSVGATAAGDGIHARIARRVRARRAELAMSLDALAAKCRVSRSMLSLIERGESSPTAVVLDKIATGLGLPLAALFEDPAAPPSPVSRRADRIPWRDPASGYQRRALSPPNFPSPIQMVEVELPPGARVAYETGAREVEMHQQVWVQQGAIELTHGTVTHRLSEGDCLAMQLDAPTTFRNRTRKPARYLVAVTARHASTMRR